MKKLVLLLIILIVGIHYVSAQKIITPPKPVNKTPVKPIKAKTPSQQKDEVFVFSEEEPEFPGGQAAMYKYLSENIHYPQLAKENNITGKVWVTFVVDKDGSIKKAQIVKDIGGGCGKEALRVVNSMPKWKPGKQRGKAVPVQYNLPVSFNLK